MAVAVLAPEVVIGAVKLVCVARQYRKGRVCMVLQVYFITQLQHISKLPMYELGQFHFAMLLYFVCERKKNYFTGQSNPDRPLTAYSCKEMQTKTHKKGLNTTHAHTHTHTELFTY